MKIAYYIDTVIPTTRANMVHVMKMCQAFASLGHSVTLLCDSSEREPDMEKIWAQYAISRRFNVVPVYIPVLLRKYGHRLAAYYGAWRRSRIGADCDCVYSRSIASLLFVRDRVPFVYESHMEPDPINREMERSVLRHKNCRGLVVISRALKRRYLELFPFFPEEKITVLHDAADLDSSESGKKAQLQGADSGVKIGYVGSLFPGKCMETLLPLAKACPEHRFHIVGGTEYWVNHWKEVAESQGICNVIFYGFVDNSKLGEYYRAFDICILPFSRKIYIGKSRRVDIGQWTSPLKLFEAMAYGKPILVSRLATIEEVMTDREDCVMVEPDNIEDWTKKLKELCGDTQLQVKIGTAAREKLCREYTWQERARKAAQLFEES